MTLLCATGFDAVRGASSYQYLFRQVPGFNSWTGSVGPGDVSGRHPTWPSNGAFQGTMPFAIDTVDKHATLILSFACRPASSGGNGDITFWGWSDSTGQGTYTSHSILRLQGRTFQYEHAATGAVLATGLLPLPADNWYHFAFKTTLGDSGSWELKYDQGDGYQTLWSGTGDNRNAGFDSLYSGIKFSPSSLNVMDDLVIMNGAGSSFNDYIGDRQIMEMLPNADQVAQFTGSDGNSVNNNLLVADRYVPGGSAYSMMVLSDYVESNTNDQHDQYVMDNLPVALTPLDSIDAVVSYVTAQRVDAGARHMRVETATAAGTIQSPDRLPPMSVNTPAWRTFMDTNLTKPGGGAWTEAAVNDLRIGQIVKP